MEFDCILWICISKVYKLVRKTEGEGYTISSGSLSFPVQHSLASEVVAVDMASSGRFIMTASSTTDLVLYDLKGEVIQKLDSGTYFLQNMFFKLDRK